MSEREKLPLFHEGKRVRQTPGHSVLATKAATDGLHFEQANPSGKPRRAKRKVKARRRRRKK